MKWKFFIPLFTFLLMQKLVSGDDEKDSITTKKVANGIEFTCPVGKWNVKEKKKEMVLDYKDEHSGEYNCLDEHDQIQRSITIKFRTCDNCIELDAPALSAIIVGNLVATFLIAFAVYSITRQPKGRNFTGNKASDKVNLLPNGEGDTYQPLTPGQNSEYSRLDGVRKK